MPQFVRLAIGTTLLISLALPATATEPGDPSAPEVSPSLRTLIVTCAGPLSSRLEPLCDVFASLLAGAGSGDLSDLAGSGQTYTPPPTPPTLPSPPEEEPPLSGGPDI